MLKELQTLTEFLVARQLMVATAESCTAGLVAKLLTDQAGSSQWFERGFVTYSNEAKQEMLGVSETTLRSYGAVSEQTIIEMASGALQYSHADVSLAISGIAGPDGGTADKPVGTVWFGWAARSGRQRQQMQRFAGDRDAIRQQAADYAIQGMLEFLQDE
ncbi:MAG: nicotinamide-nucleotide amidase [Gammaproteobacteria bacterium]|nr:nicotinamide-nucleotide amidase [Gammaproteobacteria bacterium]